MFVAFLIHFQQGNVFFYLKSVFFLQKNQYHFCLLNLLVLVLLQNFLYKIWSSNIFIMLLIINFFSISLIFVLQFVCFCFFLTKLVTKSIILSTAVTEVVVANLLILDILPLNSFILALIAVAVAKLQVFLLQPHLFQH